MEKPEYDAIAERVAAILMESGRRYEDTFREVAADYGYHPQEWDAYQRAKKLVGLKVVLLVPAGKLPPDLGRFAPSQSRSAPPRPVPKPAPVVTVKKRRKQAAETKKLALPPRDRE